VASEIVWLLRVSPCTRRTLPDNDKARLEVVIFERIPERGTSKETRTPTGVLAGIVIGSYLRRCLRDHEA